MRHCDHDFLNLLAIHDSRPVLDLIGAAARETGCFRSVRSMKDARFALEWLIERMPHHSPLLPDVVVLDVLLPGLTGVQFTRELRRANPSRNILIAFLATAAEVEDQDAAETAGADFFLRRAESIAEVSQVLGFLAERVETQRDYARLDAFLAFDHYGCAMLSDSVVVRHFT